jgi:hypothetical protein
MEFSSFSVDVNSLSTLLNESNKSVTDGNQIMQPPMELGKSKIVTKIPPPTKPCERPARDSDIWSGNEIPSEDSVLSTTKDDRPQPKYEFSYKQEVGTQDTFLGISGKTPGSMDCTHLVSFTPQTLHDICVSNANNIYS